MKKIFVLVLTILLLPVVNAVRIEEIYYDPVGTESGGEAVVLFNPDNSTLDLSGWVLKTETSVTDVTLSLESFISPYGYFLISDVNWDINKDNSDWNSADHEEAMTLGNSDSGIELFDFEFNSVDKVGWGNSVEIEDGMFESNPALQVSSGMSLKRVQDTNDNFVDFIESIPELKSSSSIFESNSTHRGIYLSLNIIDYNTFVDFINITDDLDLNGFQILPSPGENKEISIIVLASHEFNNSFINISCEGIPMNFIEEVNLTSAFFETKINISYNTSPGVYSLNFEYSNVNKNEIYEIMSLSAIEIDSLDLNLDIKDKNKEYFLLGDEDIETSSLPTIKNIGNVELDLAIKATSIEYEANIFDLNNVKYSFNNDFDSVWSGNLISEFEIIDLDLLPSFANELGFKFFIPSSTLKGNYTGTIIVSALESQ